MADMEDLLRQRAKTKKIEVETGHAPQDVVPRDAIRRPWQGLDLDIEAEIEETPLESRSSRPGAAAIPNEAWYASLEGILIHALARKIPLALTFVAALIFSSAVATFIPSSYSSTLQLYAPEKTDSVASRLQLFSNKIEFASFPVDFKIPLGLIARRLGSGGAKQAVLSAYAMMPNHSSQKPIDARLVSADTFYAEGSELLVIQGYANDPEIAKDITNLYWEYLENEIKTLRDDNLAKVGRWLDLTTVDWTDRLAALSAQIENMPAESYQDRNNSLRVRLVSDQADSQLKTRKILNELMDFRRALSVADLQKVWDLPDRDIQDLHQIYEVVGKKNAAEGSNLIAQARAVVRSRITEKKSEFEAASDQLRQISAQINQSTALDKKVSSLSAKQTDLIRQQSDYLGRLEDLEKLRNQMDVEKNLIHTKLRPIQAAFADATTARPSLILKYSVAFLVALMAAVLALVYLESKTRFRIRK